MAAKKPPAIALPKFWTKHVRAAMIHVVSLTQYATATRGVGPPTPQTGGSGPKAEYDRSQQEMARLREEMRIKDARMALISPHRRPYYRRAERMSLLELRAARGWSLRQTATAFLVAATTVASWMKRLDEEGPDAPARLREAVNELPGSSGMQYGG